MWLGGWRMYQEAEKRWAWTGVRGLWIDYSLRAELIISMRCDWLSSLSLSVAEGKNQPTGEGHALTATSKGKISEYIVSSLFALPCLHIHTGVSPEGVWGGMWCQSQEWTEIGEQGISCLLDILLALCSALVGWAEQRAGQVDTKRQRPQEAARLITRQAKSRELQSLIYWWWRRFVLTLFFPFL